MNFSGKITRWNDERGFGFINPNQGGSDIFVHISAFPRDGKRPILGESITFEIESNSKGKKQAINVKRPLTAKKVIQPRKLASYTRKKFFSPYFILLMVVGSVFSLITYFYKQHQITSSPIHEIAPISNSQPIIQSIYKCDGRIHCSQMNSCYEATYFLKNCPGTKMDGDDDGVPCEQQWCEL